MARRLIAVAIVMLLATLGCKRDDIPTVNLSDLEVSYPGSACAASSAMDADAPLRVAVAPVISPREGLSYYGPLLQYLSDRIARQVQVIQRHTYAEINALMKSGDVDMAFVCTYSYVQGKQEFGMELLAAPEVNGRAQYRAYLVVPADSKVERFADLKGKTIMTTAGAGVNDYFPVALAYNNMTLDDVKLTNVAESALVTSYLQNLAPCILAGIDDKPAQIEKEGGDPPVILTYADNGVAQPGYVIVAHQDTIAQNPDLVQRFVNGSLCSIRACLNDRDACTQALVDYNSQLADSADMVRKQLDVSLDILYSPNNKDKILGLNVPEDWENVLELKKKYQELQTDMTADQFYTNEFLPK